MLQRATFWRCKPSRTFSTTVDPDITVRCIATISRVDDTLLKYTQCYVDRCDPFCGETYRLYTMVWSDLRKSPTTSRLSSVYRWLRHHRGSHFKRGITSTPLFMLLAKIWRVFASNLFIYFHNSYYRTPRVK